MKENKDVTILLVGNEKRYLNLLTRYLEEEGYEIIASENGEEAIKELKEHNISLVITDLKLPKMDGFGVLAYVKEHCSSVPAIVLTDCVEVDNVVRAMKLGSFDYLTKPVRKRELLVAIDLALKDLPNGGERRLFIPDHIFFLTDGGIVIHHISIGPCSNLDPDLFGSMFTAIKMFIKDSFQQIGKELRTIEYGRSKILIEGGGNFFLVVMGQGDGVKVTREKMKCIIQDINERYGDIISNWSGNTDMFKGIGREFDILTGNSVHA